jgi:hypothetical protein
MSNVQEILQKVLNSDLALIMGPGEEKNVFSSCSAFLRTLKKKYIYVRIRTYDSASDKTHQLYEFPITGGVNDGDVIKVEKGKTPQVKMPTYAIYQLVLPLIHVDTVHGDIGQLDRSFVVDNEKTADEIPLPYPQFLQKYPKSMLLFNGILYTSSGEKVSGYSKDLTFNTSGKEVTKVSIAVQFHILFKDKAALLREYQVQVTAACKQLGSRSVSQLREMAKDVMYKAGGEEQKKSIAKWNKHQLCSYLGVLQDVVKLDAVPIYLQDPRNPGELMTDPYVHAPVGVSYNFPEGPPDAEGWVPNPNLKAAAADFLERYGWPRVERSTLA